MLINGLSRGDSFNSPSPPSSRSPKGREAREWFFIYPWPTTSTMTKRTREESGNSQADCPPVALGTINLTFLSFCPTVFPPPTPRGAKNFPINSINLPTSESNSLSKFHSCRRTKKECSCNNWSFENFLHRRHLNYVQHFRAQKEKKKKKRIDLEKSVSSSVKKKKKKDRASAIFSLLLPLLLIPEYTNFFPYGKGMNPLSPPSSCRLELVPLKNPEQLSHEYRGRGTDG